MDGVRWREKALAGSLPRGHLLETAIDRTIDAMPDAFILKPYLEAHRAEVKGMLLTEYNEAKTMELFREEGRAEGRAEGIDLLGSPVRKLLERGRVNDVVRATDDPDYRNQLFREFGLA